MNVQESDILNIVFRKTNVNQRILAEESGYSLGVVNQSLQSLIRYGYLDKMICPTKKAKQEFLLKSPRNAVILAAGVEMRMVPINAETPKALLEVNGEPLIERLIKQLHDVNIYEIYIVVGFMKERFEYLIDEYGVELVVNMEYLVRNNLYSLSLVLDHISNSYIVPCDIWCASNPFSIYELYSWYMVSDLEDKESMVRVNRKKELVKVSRLSTGNSMVGICYLLEEDAKIIRKKIKTMVQKHQYNISFWEEALYDKGKMIVKARVVQTGDVVEINTYEQLRNLDSDSSQLQSDAISVIENVLQVKRDKISCITALRKGMTNRSFLFSCNDVETGTSKKYIMRIPGKGTELLINRVQEAAVYHLLEGKQICDNVIYMNPDNGYKITEYIDGARVCNPANLGDVKKCMKMLRAFHEMKLKVNHDFDIFEQIEFYESLWDGKDSVYQDYRKTKKNVMNLKSYIDIHVREKVLTHIDAVPDNFLLYEKDGREEVRLIDWEYAGMQDPHVDIAMFCIYSLYNRSEVDSLIDYYFTEGCNREIKAKIYCYISACGLLWSNWCEYKRNIGDEFGKYSLYQYRYAKEYYRIAQEEITKINDGGSGNA